MPRLKRSAQNAAVGIFGQLFSVACNFATRMVFVRTLAQEYLGIEGLFSALLTMLSLAELGIGAAIVYALYEPLAKKDHAQIRALMRLYRNAYWTIALVIATIGGLCSFRLEWFIKDMPDIADLRLYFLLFVANTAVSYLWSYKGMLIGADQKQYIVNLYQYGFTLAMSAAQIAVLYTTGSYLGFLLCMLTATIMQNFCISMITNRMYPYLKSKDPIEKIDPAVLNKIKKNTFALVLHKVAGIASTPATNMILSVFIGLRVVAIYANYLLFTTALQRIVDRVFDAAVASIGNLGVTESLEKQLKVFNLAFYINAFLAAIVSIPLVSILTNTMRVFFGEQYIFAFPIELAIVALFYLKAIRTVALSFTSAYGLYWFTRWKAVIETIVLVGLSLLAAQFWGILGILLANCFTCFFVSGAIEGYMLFKHGFKQSSKGYFLKLGTYALGTFLAAGAVWLVCIPLPETTLISLVLRGFLSLILGATIFFGATFWTQEFKDFWQLVRSILRFVSRKKSS